MAEESQQRARVLDGKALAADIRRQVAAELEEERKSDSTFLPGLAILQVGGREDSNVYIRMKTKAATEVSWLRYAMISALLCGV